ncbi:DUF2073 domain-containing protein [archaeon]|nr:DUF2073 domain-containing protein [archaeon]
MVTFQFIPYFELQGLESNKKINKLLKLVKEDKILLLEGKLHPEEEAELIRKTMNEISRSFKGVEISSLDYKKEENLIEKLKSTFVNMLIGDRTGISIIGPANVIKEIKRNPNKIELFTKEVRRKR